MTGPLRVFSSLIQSDFRQSGHGNLEAVILTDGTLQHWYRDTTIDPVQHTMRHAWYLAPQKVTDDAVGPGSLIMSSFRTGEHRNFEVVVPLDNGRGGADLWHFFHPNFPPLTPSAPRGSPPDLRAIPWVRTKLVAADVMGPGCIIQSDYGHHGNDANFEVVVPVRNESGGADLWHFFRDNSDLGSAWVPTGIVARDVAGPGSLIMSSLGTGEHRNFEVVVPVRNASGGADLRHFFRDNSNPALPWVPAQIVAPDVAGPGCLIASDFTYNGKDGNFEVVVPLPKGGGIQLRHYFHDNSNLAGPWQRAQMITDSCSGGCAIVQSDFRTGEDGIWGEHGTFEVIVEECSSSVVAYVHANVDTSLPGRPWFRHVDTGLPWFRQSVVIREQPAPPRLGIPWRVCQLTGEHDRTGWNGTGDPKPAFNTTETQFFVLGTDLGSSFEHQGRTYFLFGDTSRIVPGIPFRVPFLPGLDSVAFATTRPGEGGLQLQFLPEPPIVSGGNVSQGNLEVPLDGVSDGESIFVFFSTDNRHVQGYEYDLMGRSVLARSTDGMGFDYLWDFSADKFVNVSVVRGRVSSNLAASWGWPQGTTDVLWLWGSGRYRSSDVYLAVVPFDALATPLPQGTRRTRPSWTRFFSGRRDAPAWSPSEEDATALFCNGSVGELCIRWNPYLSRWLATFNSDNPRGILLHWAERPWGPWSETPLQLLDKDDAYRHYMHFPKADNTQDDVLPRPDGSFTMRNDEFGGEYGPYQIGHFATKEADGSRIWWTLSTWNPYQVMLMTSHIPLSAVTAPPGRIDLHRPPLP
jgi:uncharacterized protein DUF4185